MSRISSTKHVVRHSIYMAAGSMALVVATAAFGQVSTVPTMNPADLEMALNPQGLSINDITFRAGLPGQFGTYSNFEIRPVTIRPGIVLSSGNVAELGPIPGATEPSYDPATPPPQVNNWMTPLPDNGGTPEFDTYGLAGKIDNFEASYDVAALRVDFTLERASPIKFDFIFGSVEFPFYTSSFTDSFLVFLDGTTQNHQITYDSTGTPVQVGRSFADLETVGDLNTAFSNPHALIHHLTTTSSRLSAGHHYLIFEIGDVNDHILDSAVFIANFRAEEGAEGTDPTEDPDYTGCPNILQHPDTVYSCRPETVEFSVLAEGDAPLAYQWLKDHEPIDPLLNPSAATRTLVLDHVQPSDAGEYECEVSNACDTIDSDSADLAVCLADFNCDEEADSQDFFDFLNAFFGAELVADVNADSVVDSQDYFDFLGSFFDGCST